MISKKQKLQQKHNKHNGANNSISSNTIMKEQESLTAGIVEEIAQNHTIHSNEEKRFKNFSSFLHSVPVEMSPKWKVLTECH